MSSIAKSLHKKVGKLPGVGNSLNTFMDPLGAALVSKDQRKQISELEAAVAASAASAMAEPSIPVMPLAGDAAAVTAKKKSVAAQRTRRGRRSTILTALDDNEGVLGA